MKAIILCAGKGERLRPLTNTIPKPMIPIAGIPLLQYNILLLRSYGIKEIAINTSYLPETIKGYFGTGALLDVKINYSYEESLLGTAGAINNFREFFDEDFIVLYGDNLTDINLTEMINFHKTHEAFATIALHKQKITNSKTTPGAVVVDKDWKITLISERPSNKETNLLRSLPESQKFSNSGIYILNKNVLKYIAEGRSDFAVDILPKLIGNESLYGYYSDDYYYMEVGQPERYNLAKTEIESGKVELHYPLKKALFLDRDGITNKTIKRFSKYHKRFIDDSPLKLSELKFNEGIKDLLDTARTKGFKPIIITNQPSILKGNFSLNEYEKITSEICKLLSLDRSDVFECLHKEGISLECKCRKPKPGLFLMAKGLHGIDLKKSIMIGDSSTDIIAAKMAGVSKTIFVKRLENKDQIGNKNEEKILNERHIKPDFNVESIKDIKEIIEHM